MHGTLVVDGKMTNPEDYTNEKTPKSEERRQRRV